MHTIVLKEKKYYLNYRKFIPKFYKFQAKCSPLYTEEYITSLYLQIHRFSRTKLFRLRYNCLQIKYIH